MPAFQRFPKEAEIIGRLLVGYGELEFILGLCLNYAVHGRNTGVKTLFRLRSEAHRLDVADALLRPCINTWGLDAAYKKTLDAIRHCKNVRNQFAHCHWGDHDQAGLFFVKIEDTARGNGEFHLDWYHVDYALLVKHEAFFDYALKCLNWLHREIEIKTGHGRDNYFRMPRGLQPPPLHNPQAEHIPPWQSLDDQPRPPTSSLGKAKPSRSRGS